MEKLFRKYAGWLSALRTLFVAIVMMFAIFNTMAEAHGGGTNQYGCHNDNKNQSYHCHKSKGKSQSNPENHQENKYKNKWWNKFWN